MLIDGDILFVFSAFSSSDCLLSFLCDRRLGLESRLLTAEERSVAGALIDVSFVVADTPSDCRSATSKFSSSEDVCFRGKVCDFPIFFLCSL